MPPASTGDGWEYLCKSCGLAAEWSQQDSCSGLLSPSRDMCYRSRHCSPHRSLQRNTHSVRQTPQKIQSRCCCDLLISSNWNSIHAYWCNCKNEKTHHYIYHYFCVKQEQQANQVLSGRREWRGREIENSNECSRWMRLPIRGTNERRPSLGNRVNTAKHGSFIRRVCTVCACVWKVCKNVHVCVSLVKGKLWPPKVFYTVGNVSPPLWRENFHFADTCGQKPPVSSCFWQNLPGILGDKKAISAPWSLC